MYSAAGAGALVVGLGLILFLGRAKPVAAGPISDPDVERAPANLKLDTAAAALRTQLGLLQGGTDADFRSTFLPHIREILTEQSINACRDKINNAEVHIAWDKAKDSRDAEGRATTKVKVFGNDVGFHDVNGQYLADFVWCNPPK